MTDQPPSSLPPAPGLRAQDIWIWRSLDAAANRASEGLRVIEDFARYGQNDRLLTGSLKSLRHELDRILAQLGRLQRLHARDTTGDVGTSIQGKMESRRDGLEDLLTANFKRVQQSLRSLEEFTKLHWPELSASLEQLRYRSYTLEKCFMTMLFCIEEIPEAALYVLVDCGPDEESFARLAKQLVLAEVDFVQLRDKTADDRTLVARARRLRQITQDTPTKFVVNDRPDLALLAGADGTHVGQEELKVREVRQVQGAIPLVGVSTHSLQQAEQAVLDGANYIGVGPTFASTTKSFQSLAGIGLVREVSSQIALPAFAIGGIGPENVQEVVAAGTRRVAVSASVTKAEDPLIAAKALKKLLQN